MSKAASAQETTCCEGWMTEPYARCIVHNAPCALPDSGAIEITTLTAKENSGSSCPYDSTPCRVTPYRSCCLEDCTGDPSYCSGSLPTATCCAGYCGDVDDMENRACMMGTTVPRWCPCIPGAIQACCFQTSIAVPLSLLAGMDASSEWSVSTSIEWTVSMGDAIFALPSQDAGPEDAGTISNDAATDTPTEVSAPTGMVCSVSNVGWGGGRGLEVWLGLFLVPILRRRAGLLLPKPPRAEKPGAREELAPKPAGAGSFASRAKQIMIHAGNRC
jgi:hypothetical protein